MKRLRAIEKRYRLQIAFGIGMLIIVPVFLWGNTAHWNNIRKSATATLPGKPQTQEVGPTAIPIGGLLKKERISPNKTRFLYYSGVTNRPNEKVTTDDETETLFQRFATPLDSTSPDISDYLNSDGQPEAIVQGSKFYGPGAATYIYATRGFAFVGNSNNKVLEVHTFPPTTVDAYKQNPESDILGK